MDIIFAEQSLQLMPERALYWPAKRTLFVADTHFGKDAVFRRRGIAIPVGDTENNLQRLSTALQKTQAEQLIILGDFIHAPPQAGEPFYDSFSCWREKHQQLTIQVVLGNHDRSIGRLPKEWRLSFVNQIAMPPFVLVHEPENFSATTANVITTNAANAIAQQDTHTAASNYFLAGHIHPTYSVSLGRSKLRLPVFWQQKHGIVLPSFGEFTGGFNIQPAQHDRCYGVADGIIDRVF